MYFSAINIFYSTFYQLYGQHWCLAVPMRYYELRGQFIFVLSDQYNEYKSSEYLILKHPNNSTLIQSSGHYNSNFSISFN